jgi:hypothetical protein
MLTAAVSPGVKWPENEAGHVPPFRVKLKNYWSYTSTYPYFFMT